jgi:hypothetical protein
VAVLAAAGAAWWKLRRRQPAAPAIQKPDANGVAVQCPQCDKRLKLPAHMAGKKVKCPGCATSFVA